MTENQQDPELDPAEQEQGAELDASEHQEDARWSVAEWHGRMLVDRYGEKIGKLQDVYVDVETDEPQFATVKEGFIARHLTFVPLGGIKVGPDSLQAAVSKAQVEEPPPTSSSTARSSPRQMSQACTTTSSSTTHRPRPRVDAGSPAADASPAGRRTRATRLLIRRACGVSEDGKRAAPPEAGIDLAISQSGNAPMRASRAHG